MDDFPALPRVPSAKDDDPEDVSWALSTAEAMWSRGEHADAIKWVRRAAEAASEVGADIRAVDLAKTAADLTSALARESAMSVEGAPSSRPRPPSAQPPKPPGSSRPHRELELTPVAGAGSGAIPEAPSTSPLWMDAPQPLISSSDGKSVPPSRAETRPPAAAAPAGAKRPMAPRAPQQASTTPPASSERPKPVARPIDTAARGAIDTAARGAIDTAARGAIGQTPPRSEEPRADFTPAAPRITEAPRAPAKYEPRPGPAMTTPDTTASFMVVPDIEPEEASGRPTAEDLGRTAAVEVPRRPGSEEPAPITAAPRAASSVPTGVAVQDGNVDIQVIGTAPPPGPIAWQAEDEMTVSTHGGNFEIGRVVASAEAARAKVPEFVPPTLRQSQAVRVIVWKDAAGVHVAPQGTVVSAITVDAILVALDESADLSAWLVQSKKSSR